MVIKNGLHGIFPVAADAASEKVARGALMSAIDRALTRKRTVIFDSHNNIKGYRYQLYCIARAVGSRHAVSLY
jgi:protein KTI12